MHFFIEIIPIMLFFIAYKYYDIYLATYTIIFFSFFQILLSRYIKGKFQNLQILTFFLFLCFGTMTIVLRNEIFIKIKPSILYSILITIFYISHIIGYQKPIIQSTLEKQFNLPSKMWFFLSYVWIIFFVSVSSLNLYIAYSYNTDTWLYFKVFKLMLISFFFMISQFFFIIKYIKKT